MMMVRGGAATRSLLLLLLGAAQCSTVAYAGRTRRNNKQRANNAANHLMAVDSMNKDFFGDVGPPELSTDDLPTSHDVATHIAHLLGRARLDVDALNFAGAVVRLKQAFNVASTPAPRWAVSQEGKAADDEGATAANITAIARVGQLLLLCGEVGAARYALHLALAHPGPATGTLTPLERSGALAANARGELGTAKRTHTDRQLAAWCVVRCKGEKMFAVGFVCRVLLFSRCLGRHG